MKKSKNLTAILIVLASLLLVIGLLYPMHDFGFLDNRYDSIEHVSALFSLASVLLLFAALIYQNRDYKLQVDELKKSAEAQIKTSEALEEQKQLLLEQNNHSFIFNLIEGFNLHREKPEVRNSINNCYDRYIGYFKNHFNEIDKTIIKDRKNATVEFARYVKNSFMGSIQLDSDYHTIKRYVQFAYNIFYLIDLKKPADGKDLFTPYVHNQLLKREIIILYLANLVDYEMGANNTLRWNYYLAGEFIEAIEGKVGVNFFDPYVLTEEFNKLKQK